MRLKFKIVFVAAILCLTVVSILAVFSLVRLRAVVELRKQASAARTALDDVLESVQSAQIARFVHADPVFRKNLREARANFARFERNPSIRKLDLNDLVERLALTFARDPLSEELALQIDKLDERLGLAVDDHQSVVDKYFALNMGALILFLFSGVALLFTCAGSVTLEMRRRERLESELRGARAEAISASELKSQFVATVSHEIRTPLNGILGMAEILRERVQGEDLRHFADVLHQSGQRLLRLLNDVLDLSKIEAKRMTFGREIINPAQILANTQTLFARAAEAKGLTVKIETGSELRRTYSADGSRLVQVLQNLVSNAIKFTDQGEIQIKAREMRDQNKNYLCFDVVDTGAGFNRHESQILFQPFNQLANARERGGTGLGLTISRRLVEQMQGTLEFDSKPGEGSHFWFMVPVEDQPLGTKILLVEDDPTNRMIARELLKNYDVIEATNGREALECFAPGTFALVLMDCRMPVMDGLDASRAIRALEKGTTPTPIVAMTANVGEADRQKCHAAGMDGLIAKPIDSAQFRGVIESYGKILFNLDQLTPRLRPRIVASLRQTLANSIPRLEKQARDQDWRAIGALAHQLKVSASLVGAESFAEICRTIESRIDRGDTPTPSELESLLARARRLEQALGEEAVAQSHDGVDPGSSSRELLTQVTDVGVDGAVGDRERLAPNLAQ